MARRALTALAIGALLALSACGEDAMDLPGDAPTLPDWESSLEELAPDLPTELATELWALAPDMSPQDLLDNARDVCQGIADNQDEEELARDAAALFGVEEAEGPTIVETVQPHCEAIG
jgi:hypothetical protein